MNKGEGTLKKIKYSFYVIFHPFKGFWDIKYEAQGNIKAALSIVVGMIIMQIFRTHSTGFILNYNDKSNTNIIVQLTGLLLPFLLWCISNWCITTLVDGKGTFIDIFITTAYALVPYICINSLLIVVSNVITLDEAAFYTLLESVALIWTGLLLFIGVMTIHQFSISKTIITCFIAIVGMGIIMFLGTLFLTLLEKLINFILLLQQEIVTRR